MFRTSKSKLDDVMKKEKEERMLSQLKYKEMLDAQIKFNKESKMYGNMTQVEKRMNNYDLYAYKHRDNHQYSLIPGFNTVKKEPLEKMMKSHKNFDALERFKKAGFSRDIRDLSTQSLNSRKTRVVHQNA